VSALVALIVAGSTAAAVVALAEVVESAQF